MRFDQVGFEVCEDVLVVFVEKVVEVREFVAFDCSSKLHEDSGGFVGDEGGGRVREVVFGDGGYDTEDFVQGFEVVAFFGSDEVVPFLRTEAGVLEFDMMGERGAVFNFRGEEIGEMCCCCLLGRPFMCDICCVDHIQFMGRVLVIYFFIIYNPRCIEIRFIV